MSDTSDTSETREASDPDREARVLVASAHALVRELIEEGISEIPRVERVKEEEANPDQGAFSPGQEAVSWDDRRPGLEEVREALGDCMRCELCKGRKSIVFGDGNPDADLMFIGEGPGEQEDLRGLPFVGRAGELLTQMIEKGIGIPRSEVYICNIVKCRPPGNRNPLPPEVSACRPFLDGSRDHLGKNPPPVETGILFAPLG